MLFLVKLGVSDEQNFNKIAFLYCLFHILLYSGRTTTFLIISTMPEIKECLLIVHRFCSTQGSQLLAIFRDIFCFLYCPCLSIIHEIANCIAIFWTRRPHSLGSCHFLGVWPTCPSRKDGGVALSAMPKDTSSELARLFSTTFPKFQAPSREAVDTIF